MTPQQYRKRLAELIGCGRDQEALEFADRFGSSVDPPLSADDFDAVGGMLEGASMAVDMQEAAVRAMAHR